MIATAHLEIRLISGTTSWMRSAGKMGFCFRLTFHHPSPGFISLEEECRDFQIEEGLQLKLVARNADLLSEATRFHFEGCGFPSAESAQAAGDRLRVRLRVLNGLLGLGVSVPTSDGTSANLAKTVKDKLENEHDAILLDSISGVGVFPDDGRHLEFIVAGRAEVSPRQSQFILEALGKVWPIDMDFDERTDVALEILNKATIETSPRAQFLITYLALERLIDRVNRSELAQDLIAKFQEQVKESELNGGEADSLVGSLGRLVEQSFATALLGFADRIVDPPYINGMPLRKFLQECVLLRNKIAHNSALPQSIDLRKMSKGLREFVMQIIWSSKQLPDVSFEVPPSKVSMSDGDLTIRVK